jgi:hypothetical protein
MAAIVVADDRTGATLGAMAQTIRIIVNIQRFMAIFTISPAIRVLTPQSDGTK